MSLSHEEIAHIAALAQLDLSEEELAQYREHLAQILDYAASLQKLNTEAISPTATVLPLRTVLRDDEVGETLTPEEALHNAPKMMVDCFVVPPMREET